MIPIKTNNTIMSTVLHIYIMVIRPIITYAAVVWWIKVEQTNVRTKLNSLQRLVCLGITGAMVNTPTKSMETILNLTPLDLFIQGVAGMSTYRLKTT